MNLNIKTALILAPHTDDGELGCGATISKMLRQGIDVHYVAFSSCMDSLPSGSDPNTLVEELYVATNTLGITHENVRVLGFKVRHFEDNRQAVLDEMIKIRKEVSPDVVFSPSIHDIHQDHATIAEECMRAFKKITILQYEVPWNNYTFDNQLFNGVDESDVSAKIRAIKCYTSQSSRDYTQESFTRALLMTHGVQIGEKYAEVFEIPRLVIKE